MTYAPAYPHDPIEEVTTDIFMVRGSIKMNAVMRITRNMGIVRHNGELTLVNPIRLNADGEKQLSALGEIKHIVRLGCFHGIDDPYYIAQYSPEFWSQEGGTTYTEPRIDHVLTEATTLPFPNAELFCFERTKQPESALLIKSGGGVLLTCDSIQHYGDYSNNNWFARILMPRIGFPRTTIVGPIWLKFMTKEGDLLQDEFERMLKWEFHTLLSSHGTLLKADAHAAVAGAVKRAFKE